MINKFHIVDENCFIKNKTRVQQNSNDFQIQKKHLKSLQTRFNMNLRKWVKQNKECFNGQITIPHKFFLTIQEIQSQKNILEHFDKYSERLLKVIISRNDYLIKSRQSFVNSYQEFTTLNHNPQCKISRFEDLNADSIILETQKTQVPGCNKNFDKINIGIKSRPFSATLQLNRDSPKKPINRKFFNRPTSSMIASKQLRKRDPLLIKNVDFDKIELEKGKKKVPLFRQSLGEIFDYEKYQQEEIYIRKKPIPHNIYPHQPLQMRLNTSVKKMGEKMQLWRKVSCSKNQSKDSQNIFQRQRLQNKIMMINTVLAVNLNQTQGYKPRSKITTSQII